VGSTTFQFRYWPISPFTGATLCLKLRGERTQRGHRCVSAPNIDPFRRPSVTPVRAAFDDGSDVLCDARRGPLGRPTRGQAARQFTDKVGDSASVRLRLHRQELLPWERHWALQSCFGEMRHRRSHIFTPEALQIVRRLAGEGKSVSEIAGVIGSTGASVRVRCCQLGIKLARRARIELSRTMQGDIKEQKLIAMPPLIYAALAQKAARMQKSTDELAIMLLEAVVSSDIYEAVLDADE
jgi:hypothetical protein